MRLFREFNPLAGSSLINTPLQRGRYAGKGFRNRFSGFRTVVKTAKAVQVSLRQTVTPLKRGANESPRVQSAPV
jgi:hypothetical protein